MITIETIYKTLTQNVDNVSTLFMTDEDLLIYWRNMMRWEGGGGPSYYEAHLRDAYKMKVSQ